MNGHRSQTTGLSSLMLLWYIGFFVSLVFSLRFTSTISVGLLLLTGIIFNKQQSGKLIRPGIKNLFVFACFVYFLLQNISVLQNWSNYNLKVAGLQSGLLLIPLAICCCGYVNSVSRKKLLLWYSGAMLAASLYCLTAAGLHFIKTNDNSRFFYHHLAGPLKQHAVYFSLLVFFLLLQMWEGLKEKDFLLSKVIHYCLILFFSLFMLLLSSRLVIVFYAVYLVYYFVFLDRSIKPGRPVMAGIVLLISSLAILIFATRNPVSNRFREIINSDVGVIEKNNYVPADYFNGFQFRLLQWKLVPEILNENKGWWKGVGAEKAQLLLNQKYISKNMYQGQPGTTDRGYLAYNTHNQLLESLLINGIPGAVFFGFICFALLRLAWLKKKRAVSFSIFLILLFSMTESVFETQYGIVIFTFFPLFFSQE